ncbi:MAG: sodium:proton antiporter [Planctomycetes bacterium]|nr:sodium:proton antiporter [Planctomycetota bacterium]
MTGAARHGGSGRVGEPEGEARGTTSARPRNFLATVLMLPVAAAIGWAVLLLPREPSGLTAEVAGQLHNSGVSNPVTAVLLNFRGYDTLLEIGVLLVALFGVRFLQQLPRKSARGAPTRSGAHDVLHAFAVLVAPVAIVLAAYLLWVGTYAPGGAFQAGTVLAGLGVLLLLTGGQTLRWLRGRLLRLAALAGFATFVAVAVVLPLGGRGVLEYPVEQAKWLILLIETAATISIAAVLIKLFEAIISPRVLREGGEREE